MKSYVCITTGEWRNLCSTGRIRIQEARTVSSLDQLSSENFYALFSLAAERFSLGETSDFLITEYGCLRSEIEGIQPPGFEIGVRWLLLADVIRFFPLCANDAWAFESDAHKAQVTVGSAEFESEWNKWFKDQVVKQACINGLTLRRVLGFSTSSNVQEIDFSAWNTLARKISNPEYKSSDHADFSTEFLGMRDRLFDLVREDADSGAIFVSCPIEWINLRSGLNIFDIDAELAGKAQNLHEKYLKMPFESTLTSADDLKEFEILLLTKFPEAFPSSWRPAMMSIYVRYSHKIRFASVTPDEIVAAVSAINIFNSTRSAEILAFLLGVALGSNKTHSLERLLDLEKFNMLKVPEEISKSVLELPSTRNEPTLFVHPMTLSEDVKISRISAADFRKFNETFHVLTYAEDGFSPLDIHGQRFGLDREQIKAFAKAVNDREDVGTLHPLAPISAVPRKLVRDNQDAETLAVSIKNFFEENREKIKARRIVFDFRTPSVPAFAIEALKAVIQTDGYSTLEEVLILEM
jgi:hypothetical protein